jgi:hypothetical protein
VRGKFQGLTGSLHCMIPTAGGGRGGVKRSGLGVRGLI